MALPKSTAVFRRSVQLERQMDEFLDRISEAGILFKRVIQVYLSDGVGDDFTETFDKIDELESRSDELRRDIEAQLFEHTLIPDLRADVLSLLEDLDWSLNLFESTARQFRDEQPDFPPECHRGMNEFVDVVVATVEASVLASRAFFRNIEAVRDHVHKVLFYETQADRASSKIIRQVFASELPLERKMHLRDFVHTVDEIADRAEDLADFVAIYTIKRRI